MTQTFSPRNKTPKYILAIDPAPINMGYAKIDIETRKIKDMGLFSGSSCNRLMENLDRINLDDCIVVYERQPRCNPTTVIICGQLQMYCAMKGITEIVGYHPKNKINFYDGQEPLPQRIINLKKGHYKTKQIVVEHASRIIKENDSKWIDFFEKSKKKDDLADAYVMALSYLKNTRGYHRGQSESK
jgi:hypothetical protein